MKYNNTWLSVIVIVIVIILLGGLAYYLYFHRSAAVTEKTTPSQGQSSLPAAGLPAVALGSGTGLGQYLTDAGGMALYYFANDLPQKSNCFADCAKIWPPFYAASIPAVLGTNAADFGAITRAGGARQTTYKGWPLYYYSGDAAAGTVKGEGINGVWFAARIPFYAITLENSAAGIHFADSAGRSLYVFSNDTAGSADKNPASACTGVCAQNWPPFDVSGASMVVPSSVSAADFSEFTRADGAKQTAYKGHPLYYYAKDGKSGDTLGNGSNGIWFLAKP